MPSPGHKWAFCYHSVTIPSCRGRGAGGGEGCMVPMATEQPTTPTTPAQPPDQGALGPHTYPATTRTPGLPPPETKLANSMSTPLWGVAAPPTQPPGMGPGNASRGVPGDGLPRSNAAVLSTPPLARVEFSLDYIPARDTRETSRESQSHRSPVEHHNIATIAALPTALPDPVNVWQKVKQAAIASGDYEGAELIDVPMSGGWDSEDRTVTVYPVIRGNRTTPYKCTPFQWPILSELHQLADKHGLGSTAVANMLRFLTTKEVTPFAIKQFAKLMFVTVQ